MGKGAVMGIKVNSSPALRGLEPTLGLAQVGTVTQSTELQERRMGSVSGGLVGFLKVSPDLFAWLYHSGHQSPVSLVMSLLPGFPFPVCKLVSP